MRHKKILSLVILLLVLCACTTQATETSTLPEVFQRTIPTTLKNGLSLVEVENRCDDCDPWRFIDYHNNSSKEPIKREKVSVQAGYRAMYAYPNTHFFSNTKIEQSISGSYEDDRNIVIDAIKHEYNRKRERVLGYLKANPDIRNKMEPYRAKGKDFIELEEDSINGYEYISYTENVIGLTGNTTSQIHIFAPKHEVIITAYLLRQEKTRFQNIDEFLKLRREFIEGYTAFLETSMGS